MWPRVYWGLLASLLLACAGHNSSAIGKPGPSTVPKVHVSAEAQSARSGEGMYSPPSAVKTARTLMSGLQAALRDRSPEEFARLLRYPVLVRTPSQCNARVESSQEFVARFNEIVPADTRRKILRNESLDGVDYRGVAIDNVLFHFDDNGALGIDGFWSDTWRIPSFGCDGEADLPPPLALSGAWRVVSVVRFGTLPRVDARMSIDVPSGRVSLTFSGTKNLKCHLERFGTRANAGLEPFSAAHWGLTAHDDRFFDVKCEGETRIRRFELLSNSAWGLFVAEYTLVFKRQAEVPRSILVKENESCAPVLAVCEAGLVCEVTVGDLDSPRCSPEVNPD